MFQSVNPSNEQVIASYKMHTKNEVEFLIQKTQYAFKTWSQSLFKQRSKSMKVLASLLREDRENLARLITLEMGKPIQESRAEINKCALTCDYFADHAPNYLQSIHIEDDQQSGLVSFEPLGLILGIMPWNFPFWQVFRFLAPTLMAGNGILIKHALNVPGCAQAIEELIKKAKFPPDLVTNIFIEQSMVKDVIEHPSVRGVSLTGSDRAGASVAGLAGQSLKKCVLELGGSDPFIVMEDADLVKCAKVAVQARLINAGQSCIAAKRFIVIQETVDEFCKLLLEQLKGIIVGDPFNEATHIGPLARKDLLQKIDDQVQDSLNKGALILCGGQRLSNIRGYFYPPTVLKNVSKGMAAYDEETFGPLFAIIGAKNAKHAIEIANDSEYGLGASVWTENLTNAKKWASEIESGQVFINNMTISNPKFPFGGIKRSGYGRELSEQGIKEFVNIKTTVISRM